MARYTHARSEIPVATILSGKNEPGKSRSYLSISPLVCNFKQVEKTRPRVRRKITWVWECRHVQKRVGWLWIVGIFGFSAAAIAQAPSSSTAGTKFDGTYAFVSS